MWEMPFFSNLSCISQQYTNSFLNIIERESRTETTCLQNTPVNKMESNDTKISTVQWR